MATSKSNLAAGPYGSHAPRVSSPQIAARHVSIRREAEFPSTFNEPERSPRVAVLFIFNAPFSSLSCSLEQQILQTIILEQPQFHSAMAFAVTSSSSSTAASSSFFSRLGSSSDLNGECSLLFLAWGEFDPN